MRTGTNIQNDAEGFLMSINDPKDNDKSRQFILKVAEMLAAERMFANVTQDEVAKHMGTSKSSISRIEHGGQNLTLERLSFYADALGKDAVITLRERTDPEYSDKDTYQLRLYDEVLMEFTISREPDLKIEVLSVNEDRRHLLPLDLETTPEGIENWLSHRSIPKNREMVGDILSALGLTITDIKGIIDVCLGLSLNDSYWVTRRDFQGSFKDYNLYENAFSSALSLIAYTGKYYDGVRKMRTSPELTTGGMLRKAWRFFGPEDIWLYKGGTFGLANTGNEPYSEYYACQIARRMGVNAVEYKLENWMGILASKCKLFTDIDTSYIPIGRIIKTGGINACIDYYKELGEEFFSQLADMLVFDAVILNEDRHFGNFGLLRDNRSGKIIAPAPVFDNGLSLLCYGMQHDFDEIQKYAGERTNPYGYGNEFIPLAKRVMGPSQREKLRRLINFKFEESDVSNPPTWRKEALEQLVQDRVRQLLQ